MLAADAVHYKCSHLWPSSSKTSTHTIARTHNSFLSSSEDRCVISKEGVSLCWLNSSKVRHLVGKYRVVPECMRFNLLTIDG